MFEFDFPGLQSCPLYGLHLERRVDWAFDPMEVHVPSAATIGDVHQFVNGNTRYVIDPADIWQAAIFTLMVKTGDCEDYCILKYALLRRLGYDANDMAIILGNLTIRRWGRRPVKVAHALLFVKAKQEYSGFYDPVAPILVLDNRQRLVKIPAFYEGIFQPYQWVNEKGGGIYLPAGS